MSIDAENRNVDISPMAHKWIVAHTRRRGMPLLFTANPQTSLSSDVNSKNNNKKRITAKPSPVDTALLSCEISSALKHRQLVPEGLSTATPKDIEDPKLPDTKATMRLSPDSENDTLTLPERQSPPSVVSAGVRKFVEQQAERTGTAKSSVQAAFILHTVFSACVRHALRYGRVDPSRRENAVECVVSPSGPIGFSWSARLAAGHLAEVVHSPAVQKDLRSLLWKIVDKEHKHILRRAVDLCAILPTPSRVSLETSEGTSAPNDEIEAAMRGLFALSSAPVMAAQKAIDANAALTEAGVDGTNGVLSLFSEEHFTFSTNSPHLAALVKDAAGQIPRDPSAVQETTVQTKLALLLVDMARIRMAVVLLLLFEVLTRRYARLCKEPEQLRDEKVLLAMAQSFCTLTSTAGSRVMEMKKHRKRFTRFFRITLRDSEAESHPTLKSVFTAIASPVSKSPSTSPAAMPTVSSDVLESDSVMRLVMRREWPDAELGASTASATHMSSTTKGINKKTAQCDGQEKKIFLDKKETQTMPLPTPTWAFRCCRTSPDPAFDPAVAVPSSVEDTRVQLLRSARNIAWPFVVEEVTSSEGTQPSTMMPVTDAFAGASTSQRHLSVVRMRYDSSWIGSGEFDKRHAAQLQRILSHRDGRVSSVNGCPPEKIRAVMRSIRKSLRLVVRFR